MSVLVVGDPMAAALAGTAEPADEPGLVVVLDEADSPVGLAAPVVRWWREAPTGQVRSEGERVIATAGEGLWSRAPWPVSEELFALDAPPHPGKVLLVEPCAKLRGEALTEIRGRGLAVAAVDRLSVDALAGADIVIHGVGLPRALPGDAMAVLAAGRLLITNANPAFGLRRGMDHLAAEGFAPACDLIESAIENPIPFAAVRRFGLHAAGRRRAAETYGRLLFDVAS